MTLWARIDYAGAGGCWLWQGSIHKRTGYGYVYHAGKWQLVHRVVWALLRGAIPQGLELDHGCRVRHCCNPNHLEPVTRKVNIRRGETGKWTRARLTGACKWGHAFTPGNTYTAKDGTRACRACHARRSLATRDKQRGGPPFGAFAPRSAPSD